MIGCPSQLVPDGRRRRKMPDKFRFNHLPNSGVISHRCIDCDWPPEDRFVSEKDRAKHQQQHEREHARETEAARKQNLKLAQQVKRERDREAATINERYGAPKQGEGGKAMADSATENGQVAAELEAQLKALPAKLVEKKAYHRIDQNGVTLGYVYLGVRKPSVEVPRGDGSYERVSLTTSADIPSVLSALRAVADRAAAKKAEATPPKSTTTKSRTAKSEPEAQVDVEPDPKPTRQRKSRAKAAA
jgi:hypothetical protein